MWDLCYLTPRLCYRMLGLPILPKLLARVSSRCVYRLLLLVAPPRPLATPVSLHYPAPHYTPRSRPHFVAHAHVSSAIRTSSDHSTPRQFGTCPGSCLFPSTCLPHTNRLSLVPAVPRISPNATLIWLTHRPCHQGRCARRAS